MILMSKYRLSETTTNYLQNKKVPSFAVVLELPNKRQIRLRTVHPVPPTWFEELPDNKAQDEIALQIVGRKVQHDTLPSIVAGDLNDVAWSEVDDLTHTEDLLHEVRTGRGFYNSFSAENIIMRWPLDHIFVTKEFRLKKLMRLPSVGSDHFPIYVELVLPKN